MSLKYGRCYDCKLPEGHGECIYWPACQVKPTPCEIKDMTITHVSLGPGGEIGVGGYAAAPQPPPVGIMPRWRWLELRILELLAAMQRHVERGMDIEGDWIEELDGAVLELKQERGDKRV